MKLILLLLTAYTCTWCRVIEKKKDPNGGFIYTVVKVRPPYVPMRGDTGLVFSNIDVKEGYIFKFE